MNNEREIAKQLFDERPMFNGNTLAWTAWKMAFQLGIEHGQKLNKHDVIGCKELLVQMMNEEQKVINDNARAMFCSRSDEAKSRIKNIEAVLKMIGELQAL